MLARLSAKGWHAEIKWDGVRAVVVGDGYEVRIFNRRRAEISRRFPEVCDFWEARGLHGVLDGELVVLGADGRPDFELVARRDAQRQISKITASSLSRPATFQPFDVLSLSGRDLRRLPYETRREHLMQVAPQAPGSSLDVHAMWDFVDEHGLEGLVLKRAGATYRAGVAKAWVKVKSTLRLSAIVTGVVAGRREIGSLELGLWDPSARSMVAVGHVGSGFSEADLAELREYLAPGHAPLVVEVEYLDVSSGGQLRSAVYKGIRQDVHPAQAVFDQLLLRHPA